jgi:hypothetical protein
MSNDLLSAFLILGVLLFVLSVISAGLIRRFSKERLTLKESFFISLLAYGASMIPLIVFFAFRRRWGLPLAADSVATFAWVF